jgi:ABC-type polysaccharide/polyol phosphate transport system ATPase subunit
MTAVRAEHVSKTYRLHRERRRTFKEVALRQLVPAEDVLALRDVSFAVEPGEAFGVVGANGSGKSTLLKLIAGTAKPTSGTLEVNGRVSALLEIGAGFHPDFTGRENAYLNGSLLGISRKEMQKQMPAIEEFADIGRFFDAPVKTYSSGMYMRLGFAVAIHLDPDVLLVDEVLAVGDEYFQHKCFARIAEFRKAKKTIVLVTHDLGAVARLCDRAIWLDQGVVSASGSVRDVVNAYHQKVGEKEQRERAARGEIGGRKGDRTVEITSARLLDHDGTDRVVLESGRPAAIEIAYRNPSRIADAVFGVCIYRVDDGLAAYCTNTASDGIVIPPKEEGVVRFAMDSLSLLPGGFDVDVGITDPEDRYYDYLEKGITFRVIAGPGREMGMARIPHRWECE